MSEVGSVHDGYGGYRQDPVWNGKVYFSPEFTAAKNFMFEAWSYEQAVQHLLDTWGHQVCQQFELKPRNPHAPSPRLDKPES